MASLAARVDAWCGAPDAAVTLLQQLADGRPGKGPALITRDPLLNVPLGQTPAYKALSGRLEADMQQLRLDDPVVADR
jgi:hypothetical protein